MKPRVFISTVSSELGSIRQLTANVLTRLGYDPVWQDIFGFEPGDLRQMLRDKIDDCVGLIQIVGRGYGAEPPQADPDFGRVSYTQYELLYARQRGKKTWVLFADDGCVHDRPPEQLDLPADPNNPDPAGYQAERRALQDAWRQRLQQDTHLWYAAANNTELQLKLEQLKDEFAALRRGFRRFQSVVTGLGVAAVLLLGCTLFGIWWVRQATHEEIAKVGEKVVAEVQKGQTITAPKIRVQLEEASERARDADLERANTEPRFDERQRLRDQAAKAHEIRMSRIKDLAASFVELEQRSESSPVFGEMTRILNEEKTEGVDKAIAYVERQRPALLKSVRARQRADQERNRTELLPLLKAAELEQVRGRSAAARTKFAELLELEPAWPQALESFAYFLYDQSGQAAYHGELRAGLDDARQSFDLAERLFAQDGTKPESQRVLSVASNQLGDLLVLRRQFGDADQVLSHFTRSLELDEALLKQNPTSAQAARDISVSLEKLGDFLARRGQAGDAEPALRHYTRSLEIREALQKRNLKSALAARDVSVSLNKLGDFLAERGQPGDAEQALRHFTRSLEIREALEKQNPDSGQAARDVSISLNKLGNFLGQRGQPGDAEQALRHFTRSLEIREALQKSKPDSAEATRDVAVSLNDLGNFLAERGQPGDAEEALRHYKRDLEISEALLKRDQDSARAARDVSVSLNKLGDFLAQRGQAGDAEEALRHYVRSLEISEGLQKRNSESAQAARDVELTRWRLGDLDVKLRRFESAIACYEAGIAVLNGMIANRVNEKTAAREKEMLEERLQFCRRAPVATGDWAVLIKADATLLPALLSLRATELAKQARLADVAQAGAKLRELEPKTNGNLYDAACAFSLCSGLAVKNKPSPTPAEEAERKKFVELSLACLKEAIAAGFNDFAHMKKDAELAPLRSLPEFEKLFSKPRIGK